MSPEAQRIAIAEACGIKTEPCTCMGGEISRNVETKRHIPDYLNDLNAMHEAEESLTEEQLTQMNEIMYCDMPQIVRVWRASAAQRCEAFLRTVDKWTDE